jgi:hypothetical protein
MTARMGVITTVVGLCVIGFSGGAWADDAKMAGTWFCTTTPAPVFGINSTEMLLIAGPRGTIRTSETDDLTGFNPTLASMGFLAQTSGAGGWKKVHGRTFDLNYLQFAFFAVGPDAGRLGNLSRFRCRVKLRGDALEGSCSVEAWFASDPDGDGIPDSPNPVTTPADLALPDAGGFACDRIPVLPPE